MKACITDRCLNCPHVGTNTIQLLTLLSTAAVLLLSPALAAPVDTTDATATAAADAASSTTTADSSSSSSTGTSGGKTPEAIQAANYGAPRCKTAALEDLCISGNAESYCDANGFHCAFMASCKGVCWCE